MRIHRQDGFALGGVVFLVLAVAILVVVPPADGYELSLYGAYPVYFWLFVVGAICSGSLAVFERARTRTGRTWVFGLLVVVLTDALLLLLPFVRGYRMYGKADAMSHLGYATDIVTTGGFDSIYPPTHLLLVALTDATGVGLMTGAMVIPVVFSGLYFGSLFYLLVYSFDSSERVLLGLPLVVLPVLGRAHLGYRPYDLSVMLVPLVLYLFVKGRRSSVPSVQVAFVVSLATLLLYHPLTALFMIGVFGLYFVGKHLPHVRRQYATPTNALSLSVAVFLAWYSNFTGIILRFDRVLTTLLGRSEGDPPLEAYAQTAEEASPALIDLISTATFTYGVEAVLFGLSFGFLGLAVWLVLRDEYVPDTYTAMFVLTMLLFGVGGGLFLVTDLIVPPDRPFQIAKIGAVVVASRLFYLVWDSGRWPDFDGTWRTVLHGGLGVALVVLVVLSVFSLYPSPLASSSNPQVTDMELEGAAWVTEHDGTAETIGQVGFSYRRFHHALYGTETAGPEQLAEARVPEHFNYTVRETLGESYANETYLAVNRKGRIVYPEAFPDYREHWRFTPADFDRLERDETTARVYDNGGFTVYLVDGVRDTGE